MSESIIVALITGGLSLAGVVYANRQAAKSMASQLEKQQAITDTKLEDLTREVRQHNDFARRIPILEEKAKATDRRLTNLEHSK